MLYLNGTYINLKSTDGKGVLPEHVDHVLDYREKIKKLRDRHGRYVNIKSSHPMKINPSGLAEPIPSFTIPLMCISSGNDGAEEWAYSKGVAVVKDGQLKLEERQFIVYRGEFTIDLDTEPDFAYFIIYKHPFTGSGTISVDDPKEKARSIAEERKTRVKLESAIYGESSSLNVNRKTLEMVANRWGISATSQKESDQIRNELLDVVLASEDVKNRTGRGRGIDDFMEDTRAKQDTKVGSLVYEAIEKKIVRFNDRYGHWEVNTSDGTAGAILASVPAQDIVMKEEVLVDRVLENPNVYKILVGALGFSESDVEDRITFGVDDVLNVEDWNTMKKWASQLGISSIKIKKEPLREAILEELHKRMQQK